jgi:hypothetical protein
MACVVEIAARPDFHDVSDDPQHLLRLHLRARFFRKRYNSRTKEPQ